MDLITTLSAYLSTLKCENGDFSILMRDISLHIYSLPESFQFEDIESMGEIMVSNTWQEVLICNAILCK
jgi:hypothetical protein